ncbi:sulfite exporter TauE/SafE family protein, partial [Chamaesiphon sp. VAR_48_metabat_403]|uniref:sulfite exporter TauE/SafE family protein n=1 Tax=Chamaesiphon sp. VAR_48_metabat_403 TaxID=2964700 RepID=UPI00286E962C
MPTEQLPFITISIVVIAFLYSSVGHGGASGYIAVMSLFGIAPTLIKPTALILNIFVACIGSWQFWRMGFLSWKLFLSLAALSIPMSFLGGYLNLPTPIFKTILGVTLLLSAIRFLIKPTEDTVSTEPILPITLLVGG